MSEPHNFQVAERRTYKATEVAQMLGASLRWVYDQAEAGQLPSVRIGGRVLFLRDEIDALVPPRAAVPPSVEADWQ
jgi:excisionase family DNA binding protein